MDICGPIVYIVVLSRLIESSMPHVAAAVATAIQKSRCPRCWFGSAFLLFGGCG